MSELHRAALAFGVAATLLAATSAFAVEAAKPDGAGPVSADTQQAVALVSGGVAAKASGDPSCPSVALAPDGAARRADGAKTTLDGLARDCANLGAETIVKVALVGEGARKRAKDSTAFDAPMTIQVRDAEGRDVATRRINVKVEMPEGVQKVSFRHVEENVSLPPPSADGYAKWTIIVGLDPTQQDIGDVAAAEEEQAASEQATPEQAAPESTVRPRARSSRGARSKRYRSVRVTTVRRANNVARRRIVLQPPQPAAPAEQPVRVTTTTRQPAPAPAPVAPAAPRTPATSGSSFAKAAAAFTERRDRALESQRVQPAPTPTGRQRPQAQQPRASQQPQVANRRAPQAARQRPQTVRTAENDN